VRVRERLDAKDVEADRERDEDRGGAVLRMQDPERATVDGEVHRAACRREQQVLETVVLVADLLVTDELATARDRYVAAARSRDRGEHIAADERLRLDLEALPLLDEKDARAGELRLDR